MDVGPGKWYFWHGETSTRHVNKTRDKPPYNFRYGSNEEKMEAGHRVSLSPPLIREKKKQNPLSTKQRLQSSQEPSFHISGSATVFSFGAETNSKNVTSSSLSDVCGSGVRSFVGTTLPLGSVSSGKGDGRDRRLEQARMGNSSKGKNHGGIFEHAGTYKS